MKKTILTALAVSAVLCFAVPAAAETYVAPNGVLSIDLPSDSWKAIQDPDKWIVLSDGANYLTVEHYSNGEKLPEITVASEHFVNVYQAAFSTQNEVFILTGSIVNADKSAEVARAISSAKVLIYDTKHAIRKDAEPSDSAFTVIPDNRTMYVTADPLCVRQSWSKDEKLLGYLGYGTAVKVTGVVRKNGEDFGWRRIDYNGNTAYVSASFLSGTRPSDGGDRDDDRKSSDDPDFTGNARTVYSSDGSYVTIYEATDQNWYDSRMRKFIRVSDTEFTSGGEVFSVNRPPVDSDIYATGDSFTVFWRNGNATSLTPYSDGSYYTPDWLKYWSNGDGTYSGADGSTLYDYEPDLSRDDDNDDSDDAGSSDDSYDIEW